jgi:hypothetical protein
MIIKAGGSPWRWSCRTQVAIYHDRNHIALLQLEVQVLRCRGTAYRFDTVHDLTNRYPQLQLF